MKKILLSILALVLLNVATGYAQNITIVDIPGQEVIFIKSLGENNTFAEFYRLQYSRGSASMLIGYNQFQIQSVNSTGIVIRSGETTFTFSTTTANGDRSLGGYGFGRAFGDFKLVASIEDGPILSYDPNDGTYKKKPKDFNCHSGGEGASSCSTNSGGGGASINVEGGCSVTCNTNYYACCDATKNECKCFNAITHQPEDGPPTAAITVYSY